MNEIASGSPYSSYTNCSSRTPPSPCAAAPSSCPLLVKGQLDGAAAQGLGGVLLEQFVYDEYGLPLAISFMDYLLPSLAELPEVESFWFEYPASNNPLGVKGAGSPGIICSHA